ncbi:MAG: transcription factor IWS1 [Amphiamblys sp. WSBS2006]|nr:MAG: transcription factor IWS1 [Amphiamblys sp. WSBS2006]
MEDTTEDEHRWKKKRSRTALLFDPVSAEENAAALKKKMRETITKDRENIQKRIPGVLRMKLLPSVVEQLEKRPTQEIFLDANILEEIRIWLEPLGVCLTFPCPELRDTLLRLLFSMPIQVDHLRESGVGKIVMFYSRTKTGQFSETKKHAKRLMKKWIQEMFQE